MFVSFTIVFFLLLSLSFFTVGFGSYNYSRNVSAQVPPPPPIWPTIQHDFGRTSVASSPGPASNSTDWIFGPEGSFQSSPVIGPTGTIYATDDNDHLFALNPDGSIQWEQSFNETLFSPAIGPSGTVYVPGSRHLYAYAPDGIPVWTVPANISTSRSSALAISPQGILYEINANGTLSAINPFGPVASILWSANVSCIPSTLAVGPSGSLYCGTTTTSTGGALDSISSSGQLQWSYSTNSVILVAPTVNSGGTIFVVTSGGEVLALSSSGTLQWMINNIHQEITSAVIGPGDTLYVAGDKLAAISQSGVELWTEFCYPTSSSLCYPFGPITSMAVDSAGTLYVGTNNSGLIALNDNGGLVWGYTQLPSGEGSLSPIAIGANGTMYVGTGCLYCNSTTYGHLLAIGQPPGYLTFSVSESGLPSSNPWTFLLNGENYTTSATQLQFSLPNGSYSWQTPPAPLPNSPGVRYAASVLQGNFNAPGTNNVSLDFSIEYQLNFTASPILGGSVSPTSGQWFVPGSVVQIQAQSSPDYSFGLWSTILGNISATNSTTGDSSIVVNGPGFISGIFDPLITLSAGSGGSIVYLDPPYVGTLLSGQTVSFYSPSESVLVLTAKSVPGFAFQSWNTNSSLGIDPSSSTLELKTIVPSSLTAEFSLAPTTASTSSTGQFTIVSTTTSVATTTVQSHVSVPTSTILPMRNAALDIGIAIIVALAVTLGIVVILGIGFAKRVVPKEQ